MNQQQLNNPHDNWSTPASLLSVAINRAIEAFDFFAKKDLLLLFTPKKANDKAVESRYHVQHIAELKGNWNIISPKK